MYSLIRKGEDPFGKWDVSVPNTISPLSRISNAMEDDIIHDAREMTNNEDEDQLLARTMEGLDRLGKVLGYTDSFIFFISLTSVTVSLHTTIVYALHSFAILETHLPCYVVASHGYHSLLRVDYTAWVCGTG